MGTQYGQQYYSAFKPADTPDISSSNYSGVNTAIKYISANKEKQKVTDLKVDATQGDYSQFVNTHQAINTKINKLNTELSKLTANGKELNDPEVIFTQKELQKALMQRQTLEQALPSLANRKANIMQIQKDINDKKAYNQLNMYEEDTDRGYYIMPIDLFSINNKQVSTVQKNIYEQYEKPSIITNQYGFVTSGNVEQINYHENGSLQNFIGEKAGQLKSAYTDQFANAGIGTMKAPYGLEFYFKSSNIKDNQSHINSFLNTVLSEIDDGARHELYEEANKYIIGNIRNFNTETQTLNSGKRIFTNDIKQQLSILYKSGKITKDEYNEAISNYINNVKFENSVYTSISNLENKYKELAELKKQNANTEEIEKEISSLQQTIYSGYKTLVDIKANDLLGKFAEQYKILDENTKYSLISNPNFGFGFGSDNDVYVTKLHAVAAGKGDYVGLASPIDIAAELASGINTTVSGTSYNIDSNKSYVIGEEVIGKDNPLKIPKGSNVRMIFNANGLASGTPFEVPPSDISRVFNIIEWESAAPSLINAKEKNGKLEFPDVGQILLFQEENTIGFIAALQATEAKIKKVGGSGFKKSYEQNQFYREEINKNIAKVFSQENPEFVSTLNLRKEELKDEIEGLKIKAGNESTRGDNSLLLENIEYRIKDLESQIKELDVSTIVGKFINKNLNNLVDDKGNIDNPENIINRISESYTESPYMDATVRVYKDDYDDLSDEEKLYLQKEINMRKLGFLRRDDITVGDESFDWETKDGRDYIDIKHVYLNMTDMDFNEVKHIHTDKESAKNEQMNIALKLNRIIGIY